MSLNVLIVSNTNQGAGISESSFIQNALTLGVMRLYGPQTYQCQPLNALTPETLLRSTTKIDILIFLMIVPMSVEDEAQLLQLSGAPTWRSIMKVLFHLPPTLSSIHVLTTMDKVLTANEVQFKSLRATLGPHRTHRVRNWLELGLLTELVQANQPSKTTTTTSTTTIVPQLKVGLFLNHATFAKNNIFSYSRYKKSCSHLISSLIQNKNLDTTVYLIGLDPNDVAVARDILYYDSDHSDLFFSEEYRARIQVLGSQTSPMDLDSAHQVTMNLDCALAFHPVAAALCAIHKVPFQFIYLPSTLSMARSLSGDLLYKIAIPSTVDHVAKPAELPANLNLSGLVVVPSSSSTTHSDASSSSSFDYLLDLLKTVQNLKYNNNHNIPNSGNQNPLHLDEHALATMNEMVAQNIGQVVAADASEVEALKTGALSLHDLLQRHQDEATTTVTPNVRTLNLLARLICFVITGSLTSDYFYGLFEALKSPQFILPSTVTFIYRDAAKRGKLTPTLSQEDALRLPGLGDIPIKAAVNLNHFPQGNFAGLHRSGWAYVTQALTLLQKDYGITTDLYCDRTFGWSSDLLAFKGSIPYTQDWIGFLHHGRDETYSSYSIDQIFRNPHFIASLKSCRALVVLSAHLKAIVESLLKPYNTHNELDQLQVWTLHHPTELVLPTSQFSMETFLANPQKGVYQVGSWYRESYSIYNLPLDEFTNTLGLKKYHLQAAHSDRYFRPRHFFQVIENSLAAEEQRVLRKEEQVLCRDDGQIGLFESLSNNQEDPQEGQEEMMISRDPYYGENAGGEMIMCRDLNDHSTMVTTKIVTTGSRLTNVYSNGALQLLKKNDESVTVVPTVTNEMFDVIMKSNIIFLHLTDASAVNTLIEAIVRCTPVLVNPLPAVVEMLGVDYPFYYTKGFNEAASKLGDLNQIKKTYEYLYNMDKSQFDIKTFMEEFQDHVIGLGSQYAM